MSRRKSPEEMNESLPSGQEESQGSEAGPARATAAQEPPPSDGVGGSILAFDVAGQHYGLPVESVRQIVEMVTISQLPAAPEFIAGVIDFRGQVIPIIDMRRRFNLPTGDYTLRTPIVVSQLDGRTVGLIVDGVSDVVDLRPEEIELASQIVTEEMIPQTRFLAGVARSHDGLLLLLDPPTLFSLEEEKALSKASSRRRRRSSKKG